MAMGVGVKPWRVGVVLTVVLAAGIAGVPWRDAAAMAGHSPRQIGRVDARQLWGELFVPASPVALDVRDGEQFARARVPHSRPFDDWSGQAPPAGIVLIGATEEETRHPAARLLASGAHVHVLKGGLHGWDAGLDINGPQLHAWLDDGRRLILIDVRGADEWRQGHIPGTLNKPLVDIDRWAKELDPQAEYVMICKKGSRSAKARDVLANKGFTRVHNLADGTRAWTYGLECGK